MIVRMNKYTFVVLASRKEAFLKNLQQLGMVDVTSKGWEPSDEDRTLIEQIEDHNRAAEHLGKIAAGDGFTAGKPYDTGSEAFDKYETARRETSALKDEIDRNEKLADEARPWGDYDRDVVLHLASHGIVMRYFTAPAADFARRHREWAEGCIVEHIADAKGTSYFTAVGGSAEDLAGISAQEVRLPAESITAVSSRLDGLRADLRGWDDVYARAAATLPAIEAETEALKDRLQFKRTAACGESAADGALVVMEAWARENQQTEVDEMLDGHHDVIVIKERPTPHDDTPVELHNGKFARPFEFIGKMYALPKYGTMDLTRWFAPFYMLFFAFCLADAGYGLVLFAGGLFLALKGKGVMATIGRLSMWCGGAAIVFGFLVGSFFGIDIKTWGIFAGKPLFFPTDSMFLFGLSIALGVFQLIFGMVLKVVTTARAFGFKYALSTIGWIIVILTGVVMMAPGMMGVELGIPRTAYFIALGIGGFMMLFLNNPGKNPLVNLGGGLWNTYNDVTGLMSDVLSYIRLFAIGLSGGVLAAVFNSLAVGVSPDIPVVKQLVMLIILLIGHGLNLFMSTLSSMVHPMRLTFVEFYKNAGFEMAARPFSPLKQSRKE